MRRFWQACTLIVGLALALAPRQGALAQKSGGVLKVTHRDSPASMSIHEEGTYSVIAPMMGVFNNLVLYDQARAAEQPGDDPAGTGDGMGLGRGRHVADLQTAPGRQMA